MNEIVFCASPFRDETLEGMLNNQDFIRDFNARLFQKTGEVGFSPHLYCPQFLDDFIDEERDAGIHLGTEVLLKCCVRMYVVGSRITKGMQFEIEMAEALQMPIIHVPDVDHFFSAETDETKDVETA